MKRTAVLATALTLSLLLNAVLWNRRAAGETGRTAQNFRDASRSTANPGRRTLEPGVVADGKSAEDAVKRGVVWRRPKTSGEWRALANDLRAAGFPEQSIRMLLSVEIFHAARAASGLAKLPFWYQINEGSAFRDEREKLQRDSRETTEAVFGKDEFDPGALDPVYRSARFGALPDEKVRLLTKIEQDYGEVYWQQRRANENEDALDTFEGRTRIRLLEEEKERDIAAVLTPQEFEDFERRQSRAARTVIRGVRDIQVSEEEYNALYQLQRRALTEIPRDAGPEEMLAYARNSAAAAQDVRAVLGDDRFYSYLANTDPLYGAADKFAKANPGLTPAATLSLYQLQMQAMAAVARTAAPGRTSDLASTPEGRAALAPFAAKLDELLGPQLAAAYRRTPTGKIFAGATPTGP